MAQASTANYNSAVDKYNALVSMYYGSGNYKKLYNDAAQMASTNSAKVQQSKYNTYISQGMNPAQAARQASQDANEDYVTEKNYLASQLYNADKDVVGSYNENIQNSKVKDDVANQNKGRVLSTVGGVVQGIANAI